MSAPRVLVTGSRDWTDRDVIYRALVSAWDRTGRHPAAILVQGECHLGGADAIAADIWASWGLPVEGHPAERDANGRILGPQRNARMVALGADECLAFPLPSSRGTRNCMRLAREAGIQVRTFDPAEERRPLDCPVCGSGGFGDCVCAMTTPDQDAQACPTCDADPHAAPGRRCASRRCLCGHQSCHAAASWVPRLAPLADVIHLPEPRAT